MNNEPRIIVDNFLPNPEEYRKHALSQNFYNIKGPDGELYKRISVQPSDEFQPLLSKVLEVPVAVGYSLLRLNYEAEIPNFAVHSDNSYDEYAGILYLNTPEQCKQHKSGTAFFRHKSTGFASFPTPEEIEASGQDAAHVYENFALSWNNLDNWEVIEEVEMKFNRLLLYSTKRFHARWPLTAFGNTPETGRLIQVFFFSIA